MTGNKGYWVEYQVKVTKRVRVVGKTRDDAVDAFLFDRSYEDGEEINSHLIEITDVE